LFEDIEELVLVVGPITGHPVYPMLFAAVLLHLVKERDKHPVILQKFVGEPPGQGSGWS